MATPASPARRRLARSRAATLHGGGPVIVGPPPRGGFASSCRLVGLDGEDDRRRAARDGAYESVGLVCRVQVGRDLGAVVQVGVGAGQGEGDLLVGIERVVVQ